MRRAACCAIGTNVKLVPAIEIMPVPKYLPCGSSKRCTWTRDEMPDMMRLTEMRYCVSGLRRRNASGPEMIMGMDTMPAAMASAC
jgi:hypothetical protein